MLPPRRALNRRWPQADEVTVQRIAAYAARTAAGRLEARRNCAAPSRSSDLAVTIDAAEKRMVRLAMDDLL